jgi:hypothetical protein
VAFWNDEICVAIYNRLVTTTTYGVPNNTKTIKGTASQIRDILAKHERGSDRSIPITRTIKGFSGQLKRIEPLLNSKGISVERMPRTSKKREIIIKISDEEFFKIVNDIGDSDLSSGESIL